MKTRIGLGSILVCDEDLTVLVTKHSDNESMSERTVLFSNHISGEDYSFTEDEVQRCDNFSELYNIDITYKDNDVVESVCTYITAEFFDCRIAEENSKLVLSDNNMFRLLSIVKMHASEIKTFINKNRIDLFKAIHNLSDAQYDEIREHFQDIS
jgi:hypothetical protein|tara:strand:- start:5122 stop:5583 length:462 start_codon:yes stop_codon:yes gene_type:complete